MKFLYLIVIIPVPKQITNIQSRPKIFCDLQGQRLFRPFLNVVSRVEKGLIKCLDCTSR